MFFSVRALKLGGFDEGRFFFFPPFNSRGFFSCKNTNLVTAKKGKYQNNEAFPKD